MSVEQCVKCERRRPDYPSDPGCVKGGYCDWREQPSNNPPFTEELVSHDTAKRMAEDILQRRTSHNLVATARELARYVLQQRRATGTPADWVCQTCYNGLDNHKVAKPLVTCANCKVEH